MTLLKHTPKLLLFVAILVATPLCAQDRKVKEQIKPEYPELARSMHLPQACNCF